MSFIDWMFWQMWDYTKLTFRIFRWIFGIIMLVVMWRLNRKQNTVVAEQTDLMDRDGQ
jgi:hypothetical protein